MKKLGLVLAAALVLFVSCGDKTKKAEINFLFDQEVAVKDEGSKAFNAKSAKETVYDMRIGWNLGNTFDATNGRGLSSETSWGQPITHPDMIDGLAASKIKTMRMPVSWSNHIIDENYTIDPVWMERVKQVVDWAIDDDMYVILNVHHDNWDSPNPMPPCKGFYPNNANFEESCRFFQNIWGQISLAFNNGYDEHLIFESINEPRLRGTDKEWYFDKNDAKCLEAADCLNKYNQLIVDTIRASGGNNAERFIMVPGLQAAPASAFAEEFKMPEDSQPDHLMLSVHMYSPYIFAMQSPGATRWTKQMQQEIARTFKELRTNFIDKGYPVVIGEFGATNKNNLEDRVEWAHAFVKYSRHHGMTSCLWDNGQYEVYGTDYEEKYGYYDRLEQEWYFPEILDALIEEAYAEQE